MAVTLLIVVLTCPAASADPPSNTPARGSLILNPVADAYIYSGTGGGGGGNGSAEYLRIGYHETSGVYRSLLRFDLSDIPPNAVIDAAFMGVWYYDHYVNVSPRDVFAHRITESWAEGTVNWANRPSASYLPYHHQSVGDENFGWRIWNLGQLVEEWHTGEYVNCGVILRWSDADESDDLPNRPAFRSREYVNSSYRPYLTVSWHLPLPDLLGYLCDAPAAATWGEPVTVTYRVRNRGDGAAGTFNVGWMIADSPTWADPAGCYLYLGDTSETAIPGDSYGPERQITFTLPDYSDMPACFAPSGTYFFLMYSDIADEVQEGDEGNNYRTEYTSDYDQIDVETAASFVVRAPYYKQGSSNWCALTCVSMILKTYGFQRKPWEIGKDFGVPAEIAPLPSELEPYLEMWYDWGDPDAWFYDTYTYATDSLKARIKTALASGNPVLVGNGDPSVHHARVVYAYNGSTDSIHYHDPQANMHDQCEVDSWDDFADWCEQGGIGYIHVLHANVDNGPNELTLSTSLAASNDSIFYANPPLSAVRVVWDGTAVKGYVFETDGPYPADPEMELGYCVTQLNHVTLDALVVNVGEAETEFTLRADVFRRDGDWVFIDSIPHVDSLSSCTHVNAPLLSAYSLANFDPGRYRIDIVVADATQALHDYFSFEFCVEHVYGAITVDPNPNALSADWQLTGPNGFSLSGSGDQGPIEVLAGEYTLSWARYDGWLAPSPATVTEMLGYEGTLCFDGLYQPFAAPPQVHATDGMFCEGVWVSWAPVAEADSYQVLRATSDSPSDAVVIGTTTTTNFLDDSAPPGGLMYYWVRGRAGEDRSALSESDSGYSLVVPAAPEQVVASDESHCYAVLVTWSPATVTDYYEVWRADSTDPAEAELRGQVSGTEFFDDVPLVGGSYWYWVKSCNACGCSEFSLPDTGLPNAAPASFELSEPTDGTTCLPSDTCVSWEPSDHADGYSVYWGTTDPPPLYQEVQDPAVVSVCPTGQLPGETYYWYVEATNECGANSSDVYSYSVGEPPATPTDVSATPAEVCAGGDVVLQASANGADVQWHEGACDGPLAGEGETLLVTPSGDTSYYARSVEPLTGCESAQCASVDVFVIPLPAAPADVQATPSIACYGHPVTLSAMAASGDIVWHEGSCDGPEVGTGATLEVTPVAETSYYARTTDSTYGCQSPDCGSVTVPLYERAFADFDCNGALDVSDAFEFMTCLGGPEVAVTGYCAISDGDGDLDCDLHDLALLQRQIPSGADCNGNGIPDPEDLANCDGSAWCSDCNGNGVLDGCDIDLSDPDGDGNISEDANGDGVPDECMTGFVWNWTGLDGDPGFMSSWPDGDPSSGYSANEQVLKVGYGQRDGITDETAFYRDLGVRLADFTVSYTFTVIDNGYWISPAFGDNGLPRDDTFAMASSVVSTRTYGGSDTYFEAYDYGDLYCQQNFSNYDFTVGDYLRVTLWREGTSMGSALERWDGSDWVAEGIFGPCDDAPAMDEPYSTLRFDAPGYGDFGEIWVDHIEVAGSPGPPNDMAVIPAGSFEMGDSFGEGGSDELPVHDVYLDAYYIDTYEVTNQQYADALNWAWAQGGLIEVTGAGVVRKAGDTEEYCDTTTSSSYSRIEWDGNTFTVTAGKEDHPMVQVSWHGAVAFSNWRSAMEGKPLCYDLSTWTCNFGSGYRLPTEAEWEKAARGGVSGQRFPWGNTINHSYANYRACGTCYTYDDSPYSSYTYHPDYDDGGTPYTCPVDAFSPNGYGCYNMAGNVWEWCHDWYSSLYYSSSPGSNPTGPGSGSYRVLRGGSWPSNASHCRVADRNYDGSPDDRYLNLGFRCAVGTP